VELLSEVEFPWDILPIVRSHHECWDGSGYPDGLVGEEIPLVARIVCLADVYDALTSDRPYRPGFTHEKAMDIMENGMQGHFDPELFALFKRITAPAEAVRPGQHTGAAGEVPLMQVA
jgi:HD-GYP domain-containing protein (c-di-GMP phosphodiesterase class II)